ncbi:MAG TPA: ribonuclease III [Terriglobales bacterium]|jgi:ribonuclease-3|nr:ribonuclease III [Terriglobales bacterium]
MKAEEITALQTALGHCFRHPALLEQALTHSSHAHEIEARGVSAGVRDNEQLEFLGDAVLGFVTSQELFQRFPQYQEGQLSKLRAHLVSAKHLVQVADELELGRYLRLGRGEEKSGGRAKHALLVNALEAVLAALYLDAGMEKVRELIVGRVLDPELQRLGEQSEAGFAITDHKSALQEFLQATGRPQPSYTVVREQGPEHKKTFTIELRVLNGGGNGKPLFVNRAEGSTKKKAEQRAAKEALEQLRTMETKAHPARDPA